MLLEKTAVDMGESGGVSLREAELLLRETIHETNIDLDNVTSSLESSLSRIHDPVFLGIRGTFKVVNQALDEEQQQNTYTDYFSIKLHYAGRFTNSPNNKYVD
ncbi:hypothetical protein Tco_1050096, partial [Tanacetum coccineum]